MALLTRKQPAARPHTSRQPLFERVQEWVFHMDTGSGTTLFRIGMFFMLVLFVMLLYTGTRFYGLRDKEAMDMGQIARNLYRHAGYATRLLRPVELAHLRMIGKVPVNPATGAQPELFTPPVYPAVLAVVFKVVRPDFVVLLGARTVKADRLLMIVSWGFFLIGLVVMYLLAREMFDHRVAALSCFLYLFCNPLLDAAISGLHFNFVMTLVTLAAYGVLKAEKWQAANRGAWWVYGSLAASALAVTLAALTQYTFAAVILPLLVYVGISFPTRRVRAIGLCVVVLGLFWLPWMARNYKVSRTLFGLTSVQVYEGTGQGEEEIKPGELQRTYVPKPARLRWRSVLRRAAVDMRGVYETTLKDTGTSYLIAFFLVSLLHRWRSEEVYRLRRFAFWSLLFTAIWIGFVGPSKRNCLIVFMPLIIIYGSAFFYVLFERLQFRTRLLRYGTVALFVVFNSVSFLYTLLPPASTVPYPPYDGGISKAVSGLFEPGAVLASDVPEALAWYGDRTTVWVPYNDEDYLHINDDVHVISGLYITQATLGGQTALDLMGTLIEGKPQYWLRYFPILRPPPTFPLHSIIPLTPDHQQFLISDLTPPGR